MMPETYAHSLAGQLLQSSIRPFCKRNELMEENSSVNDRKKRFITLSSQAFLTAAPFLDVSLHIFT